MAPKPSEAQILRFWVERPCGVQRRGAVSRATETARRFGNDALRSEAGS